MILFRSGWGDGRAEREGEVGERLGGGYVIDGRMVIGWIEQLPGARIS